MLYDIHIRVETDHLMPRGVLHEKLIPLLRELNTRFTLVKASSERVNPRTIIAHAETAESKLFRDKQILFMTLPPLSKPTHSPE